MLFLCTFNQVQGSSYKKTQFGHFCTGTVVKDKGKYKKILKVWLS